MPPALLAAAPPTPNTSVYFWVFFLVISLAQHRKALSEPDTHRKAVYGLVLVELAFILVLLASQVLGSLGNPMHKMLIGLTLFALFLLGIFMGVSSLIEIRAARPRQLKGTKHAVWTLIISTVTLGLMGYGAYSAIAKREEVPENLAAQQAQPEEVLRDEHLNYTFRQPGKPWVKLEAKKMNPSATLFFSRTQPSVHFQLIAEAAGEVGVDSLDSESLADVALTNLKSAMDDVELQSREPHRIGGVDGLRLQTRVRKGALEMTFMYGLVARNGYAWQLVVWGPIAGTETVKKEAEDLFARFGVADPARVSKASASAQRFTHRSEEYGYSVELDGSLWERSDRIPKYMPASDFGAEGEEQALMVVPVWLFGEEPSFDALAHGLLQTMGIDYPDESLRDPQPLSVGELTGRGFSFERAGNKGRIFEYRLRVLQGKGFGYLLAGWWVKDNPALGSQVKAALDAFTFAPPAAAPRSVAPGKAAASRHASVLNDIGLHYYSAEEYATSAPYFRRAFEAEPGNPVYLSNAAGALADAEQYAEGLALLETHAKPFRGEPRLEAWRALLLARGGHLEQGLRAYAALFPKKFTHEGHLVRYTTLLEEHGRLAQAIQVVQQYRKRADSEEVTLLHADLLRRKASPAKAAAVLSQRLKKKGFEPAVAESLVETWLEARKPKLALQAVEDLKRRGEKSASLLVLQARAEYALKRYRPAKASLEAALEMDPADANAKRFLQHVSGVLGEGENSALKNPIAEVELPAEYAAPRTPAAPPKGHSAIYLQRSRAISFLRGKELRTTDVRIVKVLDASAVERFSTFEFELDPLAEEIFVNRVVVRDGAGQVVSRGKTEDYYLSDQASADKGTQDRTLVVPVSGLKPGHTVEVAITRRDLHAPEALPFLEYLFTAGGLVRRNTLFVSGDVDAIRWKASPGLEPQRTDKGLAFVVEDAPAARYEPLQPSPQEILPRVSLAASEGSWETEAAGYVKQLAPFVAPAAEMKAIATKETAGLEDDTERAAALARWVQKSLTYRAILFGTRARIPHTVEEIVRNRYGDCKDHSLLLHQLLGAAGVPSRLALVRTGGPLDSELPSLDQFDHMIVYLPSVGGGTFVDATDKTAGLVADAPYGLGGHEALVLDGQTSRLVKIPHQREAKISSERQVRLSGSDLNVKERLTLTGGPAAMFRQYLNDIEPAERNAALEGSMGDGGLNVKLTTFSAAELDEPARPLTLTFEYVVRAQFQPAGGGLVGQLPSIWERSFLTAREAERRESPFELQSPLAFDSVTRFEVPEGYEVSTLEPRSRSGRPAFVDWKLGSRMDGRALTLEFHLSRGRGRFPAADYATYYEAMRESREALAQNVVLRPPRVVAPQE